MTIDTLEPEFKDIVVKILARLKEATYLDWIVTSGRRTIKEQDALFAKGRDKAGNVIGSIVTRAKGGQSPHNFGLAADFAPLKNGEPNWPSADNAIWKTLGFIAESEFGLTWGGHFKSITDVPHIEDPKWKQQQALWKEGKIHVA